MTTELEYAETQLQASKHMATCRLDAIIAELERNPIGKSSLAKILYLIDSYGLYNRNIARREIEVEKY